MATKKYLVSLDEDLVTKIKKRMGIWGGRLSPIVNNLLKLWYHKEEEMKEMLIKLEEEEDKE